MPCSANQPLHILVVDAQGGGVGRLAVNALRAALPEAQIRACGTNTAATAAMLKAGAHQGATGENAVTVGCRWADVIVGPVGIAIADALLGEITPAMSVAVGQSRAKRFLIPINHCDNIVVGVPDLSLPKLIDEAVAMIREL